MHLTHNLIDLQYERDSFASDMYIFYIVLVMLFLLLVKDAFSIYSFQFIGETVTVESCVKETAS